MEHQPSVPSEGLSENKIYSNSTMLKSAKSMALDHIEDGDLQGKGINPLAE